MFVVQEEWDRIDGKALIDTEVVDKAADAFIDDNQKAGDGNRTHISSLEGWCSTTELPLLNVSGVNLTDIDEIKE